MKTGLLWPGHFCINPGTTEARPLWIRKSAETHRHEHINGDRFQRKAHGGYICERTPPRNSSCYSGVRYARPPAPVLDPGCAGGITQEKRNREHLDG